MSNGKSIPFGLQNRFGRSITAALSDLNIDPMRTRVEFEKDEENYILSVKIPIPLIDKGKEQES